MVCLSTSNICLISVYFTNSFLNRWHILGDLAKIRGALFFITFYFIKVVLKKKVIPSLMKYDRLQKIDFLSNSQLKRDIEFSAEQLSILMPEFVIERLNNFEISSNSR